MLKCGMIETSLVSTRDSRPFSERARDYPGRQDPARQTQESGWSVQCHLAHLMLERGLPGKYPRPKTWGIQQRRDQGKSRNHHQCLWTISPPPPTQGALPLAFWFPKSRLTPPTGSIKSISLSVSHTHSLIGHTTEGKCCFKNHPKAQLY